MKAELVKQISHMVEAVMGGPCNVVIVIIPKGQGPENWRVGTTLNPENTTELFALMGAGTPRVIEKVRNDD